jgi:pimeloyl-ACP methyl ester carboxylesterase
MPIAQVNGTRIHYDCYGHGSPLLLIHGLGSSGADWAFQRDAFARAHRLIVPDLRGSGNSAKPPGPYSIAGFAADLWALLDLLGHPYTNILGFSLGGAVAVEMVLARPWAVGRLILCNTLFNYRTDTLRKWWEAKLQLALVRLLGLRRTARVIAHRLFPHPEQEPKRRRVIEVIGANPKAAYLATIRALIGWSALDRLRAVRCATLLIAAEHDYTPLAERQAEARGLPNARWHVVAGSRHGTPFDAVEEFNAVVLAFLAEEEARRIHHGTAAPV